jgi:primosomal protein N' (replication factor Y) (superfamily II helicase)
MASLAHVVPLGPVDGVYTYAVPDGLRGDAAVGSRVLVPFGARTLTGVVVDRTDGALGDGARDVVDVLDEGTGTVGPAVTTEGLALTRWVADYYMCSWGDALRAALPSGTEVGSRRVIRLTGVPSDDLPVDAAHLVETLRQRASRGLTKRALADAAGAPVSDTLLRKLIEAGVITVDEEATSARARTKTQRHLRLVMAQEEALAVVRGPRQIALVNALAAAGGAIGQAEALKSTGASAGVARALTDRGVAEAIDVTVERRTEEGREPPASATVHALHPAQTSALAAIEDALDAGAARTFLLHGITGSGKTEVYIRALKSTLARGHTALVLVPEIALTPQTVRRFRAHFGDAVAVLHSRMSDGERLDAWRALREGRCAVAVGPRSAVFAPLDRLGLVVVDEEHESSYKQFDPAPRYHARDVAVWRAHHAGAVCVLGSATPSLESLANARAGKYTLLSMPERVPTSGERPAPLPPVRVIDLAREKEIRRLKGALSDELRTALGLRLERGEQSILLQNRRGYAPVLTCEDCGTAPQCRDCAVSLTVHKASHQLRCHYCGRAERLPKRCVACGSDALAFLGAGTQRVEEELAEVFPEARVLRMDLDTTKGRGSHRQILDSFGRGEADVLLGTQMVAKGLDFPRVTLVGIVNADTGMLLPDFRAAERTFQLLAQVAGRAGRADLEGEVILQTRNPEHPAVRFAVRHDYNGFAAHELDERHALGYPPFGRLVGVEFKGPNESEVQTLATRWTDALRSVATPTPDVHVLGPAPAFVGRVKGQYRHHAMLRAARRVSPPVLAALIRETATAVGRPPARCRVNVDVDPAGLF